MSKRKIKQFFNILTLFAGVFLVLLLLLAIPSFLAPEFIVFNRSQQDVYVTADWRDSSLELGMIKPQAQHVFEVDDEAAMRFKVRYADGTQVAAEPIYFTRGIKVFVVVNDDTVTARYDFQSDQQQ